MTSNDKKDRLITLAALFEMGMTKVAQVTFWTDIVALIGYVVSYEQPDVRESFWLAMLTLALFQTTTLLTMAALNALTNTWIFMTFKKDDKP